MRNLIFIYLITLKLWLYSGNFVDNMDSKFTISLKIDSCILLNSSNKIHFIVSNREDVSLYVHAWYLFLTEISNEKGTKIPPFKLEERIVPNIPEYILIPANKDTIITIETTYFNNYKLDVNKRYYVAATYQGFTANKKGKYSTLLKEIKVEKVKFKICR